MSGTQVVSADKRNIQALLSIASSLSPNEAQEFLGCLDTLAQSGLPNLSPLLKYILFLKGKPYTLERHFHFEPIFNTFLPNTMTLKTGRQVSKCVAGDNDPLLYSANGRPIGFSEVGVGDTVWSVDKHGHLVPGRVAGLHKQVASEVYKLVTSTGSWCVVTEDHKLLTDLGYKQAKFIVPKDKVGVVGRGKGFGAISALSANSAMLAGSALCARDYSCHSSTHRLGAGLFNLPYAALQEAVGNILKDNVRCYSGVLKLAAPSKMWTEDLRALLWKLGVPSSVSYSKGETILSFDTENSVSAVEGAFPTLASHFGIDSKSFKDNRLEETCDLMWDPIVSAERLSSAETIDIEIETHHNYILNGMVSHNSTSLASQGIILSATLPYFTTLYITPLYEMIRRFSNNYVKDFIDQSPIRKLLLSNTGQSNVLQRTFYNASKMIFSFAFLDCSRIRGVSANRVCIDESLLWNTPINTKKNGKSELTPLDEIKKGDIVFAPTPDGFVAEDTVVDVHNHGVRDCYKLEFDNGSSFSGTTDSAVLTEFGWKRISTIIEDVYASAAPTNSGLSSGGRVNSGDIEEISTISGTTRLEAERLQHGEVPDLVRVFEPSAKEKEESRLRKMVEYLDDKISIDATPYTFRTIQEREESGYEELAERADMGGPGLVVPGRWDSYKIENHNHIDSRIFEVRSTNARGPFVDHGDRGDCETSQKIKEDLLCSCDEHEKHRTVYFENKTVCSPVDAVQNTRTRVQDKSLRLLQSRIPEQNELQMRKYLLRENFLFESKKTKELSQKYVQTWCRREEGEKRSRTSVVNESTENAARLRPVSLTGLRYIGKHPVLDLETEKYHAFFANNIAVHNCQNLDETFLPIIYETMSAADTPLAMNAGTPLTMDNTLQKVWEESSQAEWIIRCPRCHYDNVPAMGYDIEGMIGPAVESISPDRPGLQCAKCKRPMKAINGRWVHKHKDLRFRHAGYHVPQIIMPMHYSNYDKWSLLCAKREGSMNTTIGQFYNEVLGESYDTGAKLVTETELRSVAKLGENTIEHAQTLLNRYSMRVLGIDWGGGGSKGTSFTVYTVLGMCADGSGIDCIFGYRSLTPHDHKLEAKYAIQFARELQCDYIAHDFGGAGNFREEYIISAGFPISRVAPISYVRASAQACMRHVPASDVLPRDTYRLDKTRSLVSLCHEIKAGRVRFFNYDYKSQEYKGLIYDFLALAEEKTDTRTSNDMYTIIRKQNQSDDFAHAVNMGASLLYHINDAWPMAAISDKYKYQHFEFTDLGHDADIF